MGTSNQTQITKILIITGYGDPMKFPNWFCEIFHANYPDCQISSLQLAELTLAFFYSFLAAISAYGVADVDLFQTVDLWEKKDIAQITNTLFALGRETYRHAEWKGPYLGPKPSQENKRDFSEEVLKAGQTVIGLQAGTNKGATQAGQNMGAGRKIILGK